MIESETGVLRDVLLCRPDHYEWIPSNDIARRALDAGKQADPQALMAQYSEMESALDDAGVARHYLRPTAGLPYQIYTRDSSQMTPWGVLITQMERPQRRGELGEILSFYEAQGIPRWKVASAGNVEGGDIHVIGRGLMAVGYSGGRTEKSGAEQLCRWFRDQGWEAIAVPFAEHFLHLDVIFCMLNQEVAVACVDVLPDDFLDWLAAHGIRTIPASYKEAMHQMACNVLALGNDRIISPHHCKRINAALRAEGFTVLDPNLDQFATGGGSIHCMTMPLRRDPL
ncbi:dimethylarginine dimethylaminohydrolase family protein [Paenirhodobacter sp.]|uniref:dimethylarginine dimethylaminohydrolase family protein n=1 Tax=Paenirhodobacter sp. TaxID=1965326 RepID=UPI003B3E560E